MKIFCQGFKSLRDGQYIALGNKLTFLVGPNSAGKSTLKLVLDKLSGDSPFFELDTKLIYRNPNKNSQIATFHAIGVEWTHKNQQVTFIYQYELTDRFSEAVETESKNILEGNILFEYTDDDIKIDPQPTVSNRRTIAFNYPEVIRIEENDSALFNSILEGKRPDFREVFMWPKIVVDDNNLTIKKSLLECVSWQLEITKITREENVELADYAIGLSEAWACFWIGLPLKKQISRSFEGKILQQKLNQFERHRAIINKYVYLALKELSISYPGAEFSGTLVSAKRTLPTESELTWLRQPTLPNQLQPLAERMKLMSRSSKKIEITSSLQALMTSKTLLSRVNQALSENLFMDNGYQIRVDSKMLVSDQEWKLRAVLATYEPNDPAQLHEISLQDAHGRQLSFEDVGSGIGYVLPALIEAFRDSNLNKVVFLQQPELHLHPALQANLTDVLIEASSNRRIVAETHSEHMILRALKRIRQTSANSLKDPNLKLTPEDVAINYFEPMPDGSTRVHILRVSQEGDFLDRWPNGFFAERDQELFDE